VPFVAPTSSAYPLPHQYHRYQYDHSLSPIIRPRSFTVPDRSFVCLFVRVVRAFRGSNLPRLPTTPPVPSFSIRSFPVPARACPRSVFCVSLCSCCSCLSWFQPPPLNRSPSIRSFSIRSFPVPDHSLSPIGLSFCVSPYSCYSCLSWLQPPPLTHYPTSTIVLNTIIPCPRSGNSCPRSYDHSLSPLGQLPINTIVLNTIIPCPRSGNSCPRSVCPVPTRSLFRIETQFPVPSRPLVGVAATPFPIPSWRSPIGACPHPEISTSFSCASLFVLFVPFVVPTSPA
jgi:hypothetical protein